MSDVAAMYPTSVHLPKLVHDVPAYAFAQLAKEMFEVMRFVKSQLKPAFMKALEAWTRLRWLKRKPAAKHSLPNRLIVSLTSYPKRYDVLELTLKTILTQDVGADEIVLWIADNDMPLLPASITELQASGLTIRATEDLRSYKKIIPALREYSDAFIVTADDDVYYPSFWLRRLIEEYRPDVREVLCHRAHLMRPTKTGYEPYDSWQFNIRSASSDQNIFFTGVGGVLYPPSSLHPDVGNVAKLKALCPTTDDVWLNWMARLQRTPIRKVSRWIRFYEWNGSQEVALQNSNRGLNGGNDAQIDNLIRVYGFPGAAHER